MLQPSGAHQGQTQPGAASRKIEQGGVTRSGADYDDLRTRMDRMQEELQTLRQERDQRSFVQPGVTSRTEDQGATTAQAASSSAQQHEDVDAVQIPVPSDGSFLADDYSNSRRRYYEVEGAGTRVTRTAEYKRNAEGCRFKPRSTTTGAIS